MDAPNLYDDDQIGADAAKILPGEYYVTTRHGAGHDSRLVRHRPPSVTL